MMNTKEIIDTTEKYYLPVFGRPPIALDHGKGCTLYDADGKAYTDFLAGIAVNALGYAHPAIVKAISDQAAKIAHGSNIFYYEIQAKAAKELCKVAQMDRVFFANSGAEANEGLIKLARKYGSAKSPKKYKIITAVDSFHGRTMETLTATGQEHYHEGLEPLPEGFVYVPFGDLSAVEKVMDEDVCGVLLEPIQGEGGVHVPPEGYLKGVQDLCKKYDALLLFDEVQSGVCRSGKWFAYMLDGVKPDAMSLAKAIGCGFPMGAFLVQERLAHVFKPGDHGSTFGGNPLACAACYAAITTMEEMHLDEVAAKTGAYFKKGLEALQKKHPDKIKDVRGKGLLLGAELYRPGSSIVTEALKKGFIINCTAGNVLRFVPPLIISEKEIDALLKALDEILAEF
jgi:acetylornithine/N-succinyldiaminopimelate aminotransferase